MAILSRIRIHPVKSLDGCDVASVRILRRGGLEHDRAFRIVDEAGAVVNAKRTDALHTVRSEWIPGTAIVTMWSPRMRRVQYNLDSPHSRSLAAEALSDHLGFRVLLEHDDEGGFPDDCDAAGPTVSSAATHREVASWFGWKEADVVRRFRPNLELDGNDVCPFYEDHLFGAPNTVVRFAIGAVELLGTNPCQRCPVPARDPDSGEPTRMFQKTFADRREATLPPWSNRDRFNHFYRLTVNTRVAPESVGQVLRVGDPLRLLGVEPLA